MTPQLHFDVATACALLPSLPLEVQHHILRLCDQSTLAIASLVSFAFLELSSPLLYNDIDITLGKQTEQLFCSRDSLTSLPDLSPHLSLPSSIHTLTIRTNPSTPPTLYLASDRLCSELLRVDRLTIRPHGHLLGLRDAPAFPWPTIFALFAPTVLHFHGLPPAQYAVPADVDMDTAGFAWPAGMLRRVILTDVTHVEFVGLLLMLPKQKRGQGEQARLEEIVFDLSWWDPDADGEDERPAEHTREVLEGVVAELCEFQTEYCGPQGRMGRMVVKVRSEPAKEGFVKYLKGCWERWGSSEDDEWLMVELDAGRIVFEGAMLETYSCAAECT